MTSMRYSDGPTALLIGNDLDDQRPVYWHQERSLITVGPPGCGKTRGHVFPNLAKWSGSAIVLDVKGECYSATAHIREKFGPVFRFDPWDPENSHKYNPLAMVRRTKWDIWEDSRDLAVNLIQEESKENSHFTRRARDVATLCIAYACFQKKEAGTMADVLKYVSTFGQHDISEGSEETIVPLADFTATVKPEDYPSEFENVAEQFRSSSQDSGGKATNEFQSVMSTASGQLNQLLGSRMLHVLSGSDWTPMDLRTPGTTVYLCVPDDQLERLSPLLRVLVSQHINGLMGRENQDATSQILFFLDEVAQLGEMPAIRKGIEVGRSYGLRLWLLVQSMGQLRDDKAYGQQGAKTLINNCGLRAFMNPGPEEAAEISKWLGEKDDAFSSSKKPKVTPQELSGEKWRDRVLALVGGENPYRLAKTQWRGE